jgi:hypothetical protein
MPEERGIALSQGFAPARALLHDGLWAKCEIMFRGPQDELAGVSGVVGEQK